MKSLDELIEEPEQRSIPVTVLRRFCRDAAEVESIRTLVMAVGVGRSTLHKFIAAQASPQPRVRRLIALHLLRRGGEALEWLREREAFDVLRAGLGRPIRDEMATEIHEVIRLAHARAGTEPSVRMGLR